MNDYMIGLGLSVKINKIYDELFYLTLASNDNMEDYFNLIDELRKLLLDEKIAYDKLSLDKLTVYLDNIPFNTSNLDKIKNRYYNRLKERALSYNKNYSYNLETAILGKILMDTFKKVDKHIIDLVNDGDVLNNSLYELLFMQHKLYKYNLLSSNSYLEKKSIDYYFDIESLPEVSFAMIKKEFRCNDNFYNYLNNILYLMAKDLINNIINEDENVSLDGMYLSLFTLAQLEIIVSYLNKDLLGKLSNYCYDNINVKKCRNSKYIYGLFKRNK